ncbi:pitrilysin family protein [Phenylobacterium aquaticum]|uniref:M16 family metallopeptidase n=1 Tax=Phenylobacterium aquaticum TaxID=1763816 RepID=UPI0026EE8BBB|nr:M16 family metallopeptidase [Phenylobacterium aquaticum]
MIWRGRSGGAATLALGILAFGAMAAAPPACAQAPAVTGTDLPQDPALRSGTLSNGLRYAVMRSATPKGAVSIRFAVDVGSYEETEAERGLAHFVEHMAFRATTHFEEGRLEHDLAGLGVAAGRDHNAFTQMFSTLYQLDLPDGDGARLGLAFRWLRDVADGVVFAPEAVERERGVVLAEKEARNSNDQSAEDRVTRFQGPDLRSTVRSPIGLESVLRSARAEDLRRFHDRWYRPDTAVIAVAGDLPVETMEGWIKAAFETWAPNGPPTARAALGRLDLSRGLDALSIADPGLTPQVRACRLRVPERFGAQALADRRLQDLQDLWTDILNTRLADRADHDPALLEAQVSLYAGNRDAQRACLEVTPRGDAWAPALAAADAELQRLRREGPTELELEAALERRRASLRGAISVVSTETAPDLADEIVNTQLGRQAFVEPRQLLRAYGMEVEDVTPQDVRLAIDHDWTGAGPLIDAQGEAPPGREALLSAWRQAEAAPPLAPFADPPTPKWAYENFGPVGRIARRETLTAPDFTRITFRNGVVLNLKSTGFAKDSVEVRVTFGAGRREISPGDLFKARVASDLILVGGLGRQSYREIEAALAPLDWAFQLDVRDRAFMLSAAPLTSNLKTQLQVMTAYVSDPGFRPQIDARIHAVIDDAYRTYRTDPSVLASTAPYALLAPGSGQAPPPRRQLDSMDAADVARLYRGPLTEAPLEVTLVGDVDEKTATDLVAATFGALPPRVERARERPDVVFLRYGDALPAPLQLRHQGPGDRAEVSLTWPLFVGTPQSRREEAVVDLLADVFSDALTHAARDRLGKTYSPDVSAYVPDAGDQGGLTAEVETYPADVEIVRAETLAVAARLARGEISAAELDAARQPQLSGMASRRQTNETWAAILAGSSRDPRRVKDFAENPRLTTEIGLDEVRAAAARWLSRAPLQVIVMPGPEEIVR